MTSTKESNSFASIYTCIRGGAWILVNLELSAWFFTEILSCPRRNTQDSWGAWVFCWRITQIIFCHQYLSFPLSSLSFPLSVLSFPLSLLSFWYPFWISRLQHLSFLLTLFEFLAFKVWERNHPCVRILCKLKSLRSLIPALFRGDPRGPNRHIKFPPCLIPP